MVPYLARKLNVPLRTIEPEPWSLGVRFQREPEGLLRFGVAPESPAADATIDDLPLGQDIWISFIVRDDSLVPLQAETRLHPGDEVVVLSGDAD
jgi:cell volume regulation protein A